MGAWISIVVVMFRLMFMMVRVAVVAMVWMMQVSMILIVSLAGGGSRARLPRLRL